MSEAETSALYQSGVYALLMLLLVFGTAALWEYVSVFLLLVLPLVYHQFSGEWSEYKKQKELRKKTKE